jgi:DNA-binding NtrC family response regulator
MTASTQGAAASRPDGQEADCQDARRSNSTILLVEDDVDLRNVYQLYLETKGFTVSSAGTIVEALRLMREERIRVVILDIFLGEDDGLELLNGIVAAEVGVPVIVMSGLSGDHHLFQKAIGSGAAGVFTKWLPLDGLFGEVKRVIADHAE